MHYQKQLPSRFPSDVCIAGGGPSGVAAAVACARQGKRVFLAESRGAFGGLGTVGLVPEIMPFGDGEHFLAGGIGSEICTALYGSASPERRARTVPAETLKRIYDDILTEAGVTVSLFTALIDVVTDGCGRVTAAIFSGKSGLFAVEAQVFIDCTGDGDLCALAGANFEMGGPDGSCMAATLCSLWSGADPARVQGPDDRQLEAAFSRGVFTQMDRHLPGMRIVNAENGVCGGNVGHCFQVDATDERSLTQAMVLSRRLLPEYEHYYKEYLAGYEQISLAATADMLGIRESRRISCEKTITLADYLSQAVFDDEIGRFNYPVDSHVSDTRPEEYDRFQRELRDLMLPDGASYGIPYGCLIPRKLENVLVAGRCVGTDRAVQASLRVIPGCYITGQAAGIAAALCEGNVRKVEISRLRQTLRSIGAYLPDGR